METTMTFTPIASTLGGVLIGLSASAMLVLNGKVAGISGIFGGALRPRAGDAFWRVLFLIGLLAGGGVVALVHPQAMSPSPRPMFVVALAGVLVGVGTYLGNGCTSGHGVCGMSRLSKRSIVATMTFMATGAVTVFLARVLFGGWS
jgi:hypothetical protein